MKGLLKRLRLIDELIMEIPMERSDFVKKLQQNVDEDDRGVFFSFLDIFAGGKNEYRGSVGYDTFNCYSFPDDSCGPHAGHSPGGNAERCKKAEV